MPKKKTPTKHSNIGHGLVKQRAEDYKDLRLECLDFLQRCVTPYLAIQGFYDLLPVTYPDRPEPACVNWPPPNHGHLTLPPRIDSLPGNVSVCFVSRPNMILALWNKFSAETVDHMFTPFTKRDGDKWAAATALRLKSLSRNPEMDLRYPDSQPPPDPHVLYRRFTTAVQDTLEHAYPVRFIYGDARGLKTTNGTVKTGPHPASSLFMSSEDARPCLLRFLYIADLDVCDVIQEMASHRLVIDAQGFAKAIKIHQPSSGKKGAAAKALNILCWVLTSAHEFNTPYVVISNCYKNIWFHVQHGIISVGPTMMPTQPNRKAPVSLLQAY